MKINLKKFSVKKYFDNRKNNKKNIKNGSYTMGITAIVVAVIVVVNLFIQEVPAKYREIDLSAQKLYTISDQTKSILEDLKDDVTLYYIVQSGNESNDIEKLLERYSDASKHIKVEKKDPAINPTFTAQYTQDQVIENSIIAVSGDKSKLISYDTMYEQEPDYTTYTYKTTGFDGEGQITSAISYVISDDLPNLYVLQGHNEAVMSDQLKSSIQKENINIKDLNLLSSGTVPEDANCLFIFAPANDISPEETDEIIRYLENGGKAMIVSSYSDSQMPNFEKILENYGVKTTDGIILEGDAEHYISQNPTYLLPEIGSSDITSDLASASRYILMPVAQGIQKLDNIRDTITVTGLLTTSDKSYSKEDINNMTTMEKEDSDVNGPFHVGVSINEKLDEDKETQIVYFSSESLLSDETNQMVSGSNYELVTSSFGWMVDHKQSVSIPSKSLSVTNLTLPTGDISFWSIFTIGLLPIAVLFLGGIIWFKRRRQ